MTIENIKVSRTVLRNGLMPTAYVQSTQV